MLVWHQIESLSSNSIWADNLMTIHTVNGTQLCSRTKANIMSEYLLRPHVLNQEIPENHSASFVNSAKICKYILWRIIYLSGASLLLLHAFTALYNFVTIYLSLVLVVAVGLAEKTLVAFLFAEYSNMKHNPFE